MAADLKKGLRNPLDDAQVRKAVLALQAAAATKTAALPKQPLVSSVEYVSAVITRRLVPAKGSVKPIPINIPHSLRGGENDAEMCLIVKTDDKKRIKAALAADPVPGLAKVLDLKKLQKSFSRFEDKRALAGAYDLFLVDDRIVPYLPKALGTKFFAHKKQPVPVRVSRKTVSFALRAAFQRTQMVVSTGPCTNVKVAHLGMSVDEIVENIVVAMDNCAAHIPKRWNGVQSISIKTNESVALPIYNSLAAFAKLPPMPKKVALAKRKLEEAAPAPAAKKAKTEAAPVKEKAAPVKKEKAAAAPKAKKAKAAAPPTKKEPKKASKVKTEEVPVPAKKDKKKAKKEAAAPTKKEAKETAPVKNESKKDKKVAKEEVKESKKEVKKKEVKKEVKESKKEIKEVKKEVKKEIKKEIKKEVKKETKKPKKEAAAASPAKKSKKVAADAALATTVRKEKKKQQQ